MDFFNTQYILKEKRWLWIDYDKGISIILVGYGHCLASLEGHATDYSQNHIFNYMAVFLYGFRMPLFFIVSGLLVARSLNKKGLNGYISDRTNNILYPLLVWGVIEITMHILAVRTLHFSQDDNISPLYYLNLIINPRETGHFWYLNALFCIGVLYAFLRSTLKFKPWGQLFLGLVLFSVSAYLHIHDLNAGFLTDVFEYYFFFALGDLISNFMFYENNIDKFSSWKEFVPLLIVFLTVQYFFTQINLKPTVDGQNFVEHKMPFFFLFEALIGCLTSVSFSFLLQKYRAFTFLRIIGYHSLFIYCMQIIVMTLTRVLFQNIFHIGSYPVLVILIWSSGIILPIFFYNFCLRYNLWWLFTYKKPVKQIEHIRGSDVDDKNKALAS